jgi:hypothetical protein
MRKWIRVAISLVLLAVIAGVAYRLALSKAEVDIYRDRLLGLSEEYESLRSRYNEAVAKTAVTELLVKDGRLSLVIRTIQGVERVIDTPFDPTHEIYCDYVVLDGRLWIRRVYDSHTPPRDGLVVDKDLQYVNWNDAGARYGKAVYRSLEEGRWVVTVTGDGSLALVKVNPKAEVTLSGPPPVRDYEQLKKQIDDSLAKVTPGDVLKRVIAPGGR